LKFKNQEKGGGKSEKFKIQSSKFNIGVSGFSFKWRNGILLE